MDKLKKEIRKDIRSKRVNLDIKDKEVYDNIINNKLYELIKDYNNIGLYISYGSEVNTSIIINKLLEDNKNVYVPRCVGDNMDFIKIDSNSEYSINEYNILEPVSSDIYNEELDVIVVPLIAFDDNCNRLGQGKGYYDRYLENYKVFTVGIAYELQKVTIIPIDKYDKRLNTVISETKIYINM